MPRLAASARKRPRTSRPQPTAPETAAVAARGGSGGAAADPEKRKAEGGPSVMVGRRLKHARLSKGYTLSQLAEMVSCSESMISKVENDKLRPSINMLHRLATALDTNIAALFSDLEERSDRILIFRPGQTQRFDEDAAVAGTGVRFERLLPVTRSGLLQANILEIPAGTHSDDVIQHMGEDFGYVIQGRLEILVDGSAYPVTAGDAFFFPSTLSHGFRNEGGELARVLWVNTPPSL